MFTTLFSLSLFAALIQSVLAQSGLSIGTPAFVQVRFPAFRAVYFPILLAVPTHYNHLDRFRLPPL